MFMVGWLEVRVVGGWSVTASAKHWWDQRIAVADADTRAAV
jgi:hypothetical protein